MSRSSCRRAALAGAQAVVFTCLAWGSAFAQGLKAAPIGPALSRSEKDFSRIGSATVLPNERLALLDAIESTVFLVSPELDDVRALGRRGRGPGEYMAPVRILARPGAGEVFFDRVGERAIAIDGDGRLTTDPSEAAMQLCRETAPPSASVHSIDSNGRLHWIGQPVKRASDGSLAITDSAPLLRWAPTCRVDTLEYVGVRVSAGSIILGGRVVGAPGSAPEPFRAPVQVLVDAEGTLLWIEPNPYRIQGLRGDGQRFSIAIPHEPMPVTDEIKQRWLADARAPRPVLTIARSGGTSTGMASERVTPPSSWPRLLPPFLEDAMRVTPAGVVWIESSGRLAGQPAYDVVDPRTGRMKRVTLEPGCRLLAVGRRSAYLACKDADGLDFVTRTALVELM
jgi:hypothetical protein